MRSFFWILALTALSLAFVACGDDDNDGTNTPIATHATNTPASSAGATTINVQLRDYEIIPNPTSGSPGEYDFKVTNSGPSVHEFVLVKTDLDATDLPTDADGAVDEESDQIEAVDELEDVAVNGDASFNADISAGHYVYFCNIVEDDNGTTIAHYTNGMRGNFTVE